MKFTISILFSLFFFTVFANSDLFKSFDESHYEVECTKCLVTAQYLSELTTWLADHYQVDDEEIELGSVINGGTFYRIPFDVRNGPQNKCYDALETPCMDFKTEFIGDNDGQV